jgi:hypothetical protein
VVAVRRALAETGTAHASAAEVASVG